MEANNSREPSAFSCKALQKVAFDKLGHNTPILSNGKFF